ncbi:zinc metalloproteinase nas-36-like [Liolophura sinensis]|uniref:zinc metalloproteinase nas-36-like n=1 Tax=Liolophura sinensis TaxID=3198878 RepID=UPI003158B3BA
MKLAPLLGGEPLPDRAYVWCRLALLYHSLATNVKIFDVEKLNLFDGDIILSRENVDVILATFYPTPDLQYAAMDAARDYQRHRSRARPKRKAVADGSLTWDNALVPFSIDDKRIGKHQKDVIYEAISQWEQSTCVRFQEQRGRAFQPHVYFMGVGGCSSSFGRQSSGQFVYLGEGCDVVGIAAHEIGHALGFYHEHARPDRDRYVSIYTDNVGQRYHRQFVKSEWTNAKTFGIPYDYSSVLHYSSTTFAEQKQSIVTKDPEMQKVIGQREGVSFFDIKMANKVYCSDRCEGRSLEWSECAHGGYRNPNNCSSCLCPRGLAPPRCESPAPGVNGTYHFRASSPGKHIKLEFSGNFDFNEERENSVCYDYVEVRYKGLERAGPRFCGRARPTKTFISHGEEVLLSINTDPLAYGKQGFRVKYSEGGGSSGHQVRIVTQPPVIPSTRRSTTTTTTTRRPYRAFIFNRLFTQAPRIAKVVKATAVSSWGTWSAWTACSATCGLCGKQERRRSCRENNCM